MKYWETEHFKALQRQWYERLEGEGFLDAEELVGSEMMLRQCAEHVYRDSDEIEIATKEAYYQILARKFNEARFKNNIDRLIMMRHAEGARIQAIVGELEELGMRRCRNTVFFRIRRYEMKWGIRTYTPKQLNHLKTS